MVDKDNDVVMFNPKNNKEITKTHICKGVRADSWYTNIHILNKYNNSIQGKKGFYDEVISV